ncbi:MAG: F0F1 ATP synthase subunit A [Chloroflexota bacterium]
MPKKGCLGCSFPVFIGLLVFFLVIIFIGFAAGPIGRSLLPLTLPAWLSVSQPRPELPAEVVFHLFGFPVTNTIIGAWLTTLVLVVLIVVGLRRPQLVPKRGQAFVEFIFVSLLNFCESVAGEKNGRRFFPYVAAIFLFVMFNAYLSLLPGFGSILVHTHEGEVHLLRGANTDINVPLALALFSFIVVETFGFRALGIRYGGKFINVGVLFSGFGLLFRGTFKKGFGAIGTGVINIFIGIVEMLSEFIRIISLTLRLFGNMTAGEILLLMVTFLVGFIIPVVFYGLELIVGFVQALIFAALTLIFMTVAVASHGEEHH